MEWLYDAGVSTIKVGYPKYIAQENGNFDNNRVWTYRYLLKRIAEVVEEYGISVIYVDESYTSSSVHGMAMDAASGYTEDCSSVRR